MKHLLVLAATVLSLAGLAAPNATPQVVPAVQQWTGGEGTLALSKNTVILVDTKDQATLEGVARQLQADLQATGFGNVDIKNAGQPAPGSIFLSTGTVVDAAKITLADEAYGLTVGDAVKITGTKPGGVFYGTRTLLQMLQQSKSLPKGIITDYPSYNRRMLMLDVGRKPYPIAVLQDYMKILAWYKMNELHLHFSDEAFGGDYAAFRIESKTFPGLAAKDLFYTHQQIREMQDYAKARGITITPEFDMPGHARCFTNYWPDTMLKGYPNYVDVTNPKTIENLKKLLDEMIPLFDCPDIHIGTDEYRVGGPRQGELKDAFKDFINTMNAHIRSKGKNCRIWSGFEHMQGTKTIEIDPTVIIDMWETDNARGQIEKGHPVINSNHGRTYIVPGCHYYGISCGGIYESWEPWMVSGDMAKNPTKDDPKLLGGKLHVWSDQGPTGYNHTEIADLTLSGIQAFAEKLWGTKGSPSYREFTKRTAGTLPIPGVTVFDRLPAGQDGLVLDLPKEQELKSANDVIPLPLATADRADLEYPWTLTVEVCKTAETGKRGVILSSDLAEACENYARNEEVVTKFADGTERKTKVQCSGVGMVRAAGSMKGKDPASSYLVNDVSKSFGKPLPLNQWQTITVVGTRGTNTIYLNGEKLGQSGNQMICPLRWLGSQTGNSFVGKIRNLKVYNRALSTKEIGRSAGLDIPEDLARGKTATASASDTPYGLTADKVTDGDAGTRWSSGQGGAPQWVAIDLGTEQDVGRVAITWEAAIPKTYTIETSSDGQAWKEVFKGEGKVGETRAEFATAKARHLRVKMSNAATGWGYSIYSIEVWPAKK
jgi:hexosaminidase